MHPCGNGKIHFLDVCTLAATEKIHFLDVCTPAATEKIHFLDGCILAAMERDILNAANGRKDALFLIEIVHSGSRNHRLSPCFLLILQPR